MPRKTAELTGRQGEAGEDAFTLDAADKRSIGALKPGVTSLAKSFGAVREKAVTLAPKIMREYERLAGKYGARAFGGFVGFSRFFDASIPAKAEDYRKHKVYYTLDYLRRVYMQGTRVRGQQGQRDPARDQLARLVATLLQVVRTPDPIYEAVKREFRMQDRGIAQLKTRVEDAKPLINLSGLGRPIAVDVSRIIHMEPRRAETDATPGNVVMPAAREAVGGRKRKSA